MTSPANPSRQIAEAIDGEFHFVLRFSVGTALAYTAFEAMNWQPSAVAAVLTGILLGNLPSAPPFKVAGILIVVMYLAASVSYSLTAALREMPEVLFGLIGVMLFITFEQLAHSRGQLPLTVLLLCLAVIPVVTLTDPAAGAHLRQHFVTCMIAAVFVMYLMNAIWPKAAVIPGPPPSGPVLSPTRAGVIGTAIVLPVMLVFWLFGLTDAIPVLLQTMLLISKMEEERATSTAVVKLMSNFLGGVAAFAAYFFLRVSPSLVEFGLVIFILSVGFAQYIVKGGITRSNAILAFNATMVILGLLILKGPENAGTWQARLAQFAIASIFVVGMMALLWPSSGKGKKAWA